MRNIVLTLCATVSILTTANAQEVHGLIVDVVDGDTLKIINTGQKIRLIGVDACEKNQKAKTDLGQTVDCGVEPMNALISWTANKEVNCEFTSKDRYQRLLGICGNSEIPDFSAELIRQGYAVAYRYKGKVSDQIYEDIEARAKANRAGLWSMEFEQPWAYRKSK
ncbi:hypothetical protein CEV31_4353 [Brucella thiophenivorans]|uniref:TNase-like domain-containing protein n=2 Tax=Brucella thiophenivorans TaxID=571255 RepID=A0A256FSE0_9HYPH|nr:hypothetical protein CEV31_4353 [Brucella thiophenivorans]